jgi:hypothetical protein
VVSNERLKRTTGWSPRHTSRETFEITMRTHGKLPPTGATTADRTTATLAA